MLLSLPLRVLRVTAAILIYACALTGLAPAVTGAAGAARAGAVLYTANWYGGFGGWTTLDKKPLQGAGWHLAGGQLVSDGGNSVYARAPYEPGLHEIADYAVETQ